MIIVDGEPLGSIVVADLPDAKEEEPPPAPKPAKAPAPAPEPPKPPTGSEAKG